MGDLITIFLEHARRYHSGATDPSPMVFVNNLAETADGWGRLLRRLIASVPLGDSLGASVIHVIFAACPLPFGLTVIKFTARLPLSAEAALAIQHNDALVRFARNMMVVLSCIADKYIAGFGSLLFTRRMRSYLFTLLMQGQSPLLVGHAIITLERMAALVAIKYVIEDQFLEQPMHPLLQLEMHHDSANYQWRQVGFIARWALDNIFLFPGRPLSYENQVVTDINVMLNSHDSSSYLKIGPDGLEARNDTHFLESVRATFKVSNDVWYYEVTVITDGVMHIGWATKDTCLHSHSHGLGSPFSRRSRRSSSRRSSRPAPGPSSSATAGPSSSATAGPSSGATAGPSSGDTAGPSSGATAGPSSGDTAGPSSSASLGPSTSSLSGIGADNLWWQRTEEQRRGNAGNPGNPGNTGNPENPGDLGNPGNPGNPINPDLRTEEGSGVGDDSFSIAFDGCRRLIWHKGIATRIDSDVPSWLPGDTVGCLLDIPNREVIFSLNGTRLPPCNEIFARDLDGLYPAASFMVYQQCRFNFGSTPFRFPPQDREFQAMNDHGLLTVEEKMIIPKRVQLEMVRKEKPNSSQETRCVVCLDAEGQYTLQGCGHSGFCARCVPQLQACPLCRSPVVNYTKDSA